MKSSDWIALAAVIISIAFGLISLYKGWSDQRASVIRAFQGEKETVAYEAFRIARHGWPRRPRYRRELRTALCWAAIFTRSGRTRAIIYYAFKTYPAKRKDDLDDTLAEVRAVFAAAGPAQPAEDLKDGWENLNRLHTALDREPPVPLPRVSGRTPTSIHGEVDTTASTSAAP